MTTERRLAKVEAALTPTELVLRWLDEAHAFGDLESYVRAQLAETPLDTPLNRLAREAAAGARGGSRGTRADVVDDALRAALRETVFRFELVMRINVTAYEQLERELLIGSLLSAHLVILISEVPGEEGVAPISSERIADCRNLGAFRVSEMCAVQDARVALEVRYLAGHAALFPDARAAWEAQLATTRSVADLAARLADLAGLPATGPADAVAIADRVGMLIADLVEPAKATALEKVGEGERALTVAGSWVRSRLSAVPR